MIQITDLTKNYGKNCILDKINLDLNSGQVYCLLGKNGAGKTTLINLMLDLILPEKESKLLTDKPPYAKMKIEGTDAYYYWYLTTQPTGLATSPYNTS